MRGGSCIFPLIDIVVLDLSRLLPGPFCTMILADFGAEVIKIEAPGAGDYARHFEPKLDENSTMFHSLNRNKKSIVLDLKSEEGKKEFLKMAETADVVVESFRPGVMKRLGLDYETLKKANPGLVYCAITGYGQTGPYAQMPGHDINYISYAGLLNLMGEKGGKPVVPAVQIADIGGGAYPAVVGILLALLEREKSGKGQFVDISMMDGVLSFMQATLPNYLMKKIDAKRGKQMLSGALACYGVYETKDGRWLAVGALEPKFWANFCNGIMRPDLIPLQNEPIVQEKLKREIETIILQKSLSEWMEIFKDTEACVTPVLDFSEMEHHQQVVARKMIQTVPVENVGEVKQIGIPIKLSDTPGKIRFEAPKLGDSRTLHE